MALASKNLYQGTPGTTASTAYTVPASTTTHLKELWFNNTTGTASTVTLNIVKSGGAVATANEFLSAKVIPANDIVIIACYEHLDAGDFLSLKQGTANACNVRISGPEVS